MVQGQPWLVSDMSLLPFAQRVKTRLSRIWLVFKSVVNESWCTGTLQPLWPTFDYCLAVSIK